MHGFRQRQWHRNSRQRILLEYSNLQTSCPDGVYLSLKPGNPAQWSGVLFVRKGPYAPAILRFQVSFPVNYPESPPVIAFTSDIFHPLVTPLTTYTHSAGARSFDTVSASDEERLPPGGFNLKHGFPTWFGLARHKGSITASPRDVSIACEGDDYQHPISSEVPLLTTSVLGDSGPPQAPSSLLWTNPRKNGIAEVFTYVKKAFDDETTLDTLPFESAGNPGAWKAWRAYRPASVERCTQTEDTRRSDEWNWDGVWQERVRKGIEASISAPILYGSASANDDPIRFAEAEIELIEAIKAQIPVTKPGFQ